MERRGRGAGTQCRLAWNGFKSMETITELQAELVTSPPPRLYSLLFIPPSVHCKRETETYGQKCKRSSGGNPTFTLSHFLDCKFIASLL